MSQLLQYNYAILDENDCCVGCMTYSCEVPLPTYVLVPDATNEYYGKYYNREDGLWYLDAARTQLWEEAPQW
jgi:hypothetical protein